MIYVLYGTTVIVMAFQTICLIELKSSNYCKYYVFKLLLDVSVVTILHKIYQCTVLLSKESQM